MIALGYTNISALSYLPSVINASDELICVRRASNNNGDYHFMQYDYDTNAWYHKPGNTAILKYTDNGGVPSDSAIWYSEMSHNGTEYSDDIVYNSDIVFIKYSKLQFNVQWGNELTQDINFKAEKDVIYEIKADESDYYDITLSSECGQLIFNYEIYSYNKFIGDYEIIESGDGTWGETIRETVYITHLDDYDANVPGWELQANKYYVRLHFDKQNTTDQIVTVSVEHSHVYNYSYDEHSTTEHKVYCECGEYILQEHLIDNGLCNLCGTIHTHEYIGWKYYSNTYHIEKCICGEIGTIKKVHAVSSTGLSRYKTCILCGGTIDTFKDISQIESVVNMVTANGSYILPSGIIVLVDEDVEAYLNGELAFYNRNDNSEIS